MNQDVALSQDGFYQVTDNVSVGDFVKLTLRDGREFTGEVEYMNTRKVRRNSIVLLRVSIDEGYLSVESSGRVTQHVEGKDPNILGRIIGDIVLV